MNWYQLTNEDVLQKTDSSNSGLSTEQAQRKLEKYGLNEIESSGKKSLLSIFVNQFKDFMILILIIVAIISGIIGDTADTIIIGIIILLNAIIGFIQEYKAEESIQSLKKMAALNAQVLRDGKVENIEATQIVPGDIVHLQAGSVVPADIRLIEVHAFRVNESALTGESVPADKHIDKLESADTPLGDQLNMAFKSTLVTNGRAIGVTIGTGMHTEIGKIAGLLEVKKSLTPLQKRMAVFSKQLSYAILILCGLLFLLGVLRDESWENMLLISISLAVAAIPEALPALITVCLSLGARRMVNKKALVRNLPAVETLGSVNFICTDKTGTLTENKMRVDVVKSMDDTKILDELTAFDLAIALNNDLQLSKKNEITGDPTEIALVQYFQETYSVDLLEKVKNQLERVEEFPFDSTRKLMTTLHSVGDKFLILTKGAPESIDDTLAPTEHSADLLQHSEDWSKEGKRVLAFAYKITNSIPKQEEAESDLKIAGIAALIDPPRASAKQAIAECKTAGIKTVMITGDHLATATAIAKDLGIINEGDLARSSEQLKNMSDETFEEEVERIRVYARVSPEQKLKIIKALQAKNYFVAMTGDGVNDAPSLKASNIGVAMGINGTDVSKESSDMILLDDNFSTIVKAVKEGRRIYDNIRKFIKYIMTCNSAEILIMVLAPIFQMPIPLMPVHILWVNLVTDGLPGLALANEGAEKEIMKRSPRKPDESLFADGVGKHIIRVAIIMAAVVLCVQAWALNQNIQHWQTLVFVTLSFAQLGHIMAIKSNTKSVFSKDVFSNVPLILTVLGTIILQIAVIYVPLANELLHTQPLTWKELLFCFATASIVMFAVEIEKIIYRRKTKFTAVKNHDK